MNDMFRGRMRNPNMDYGGQSMNALFFLNFFFLQNAIIAIVIAQN